MRFHYLPLISLQDDILLFVQMVFRLFFLLLVFLFYLEIGKTVKRPRLVKTRCSTCVPSQLQRFVHTKISNCITLVVFDNVHEIFFMSMYFLFFSFGQQYKLLQNFVWVEVILLIMYFSGQIHVIEQQLILMKMK